MDAVWLTLIKKIFSLDNNWIEYQNNIKIRNDTRNIPVSFRRFLNIFNITVIRQYVGNSHTKC